MTENTNTRMSKADLIAALQSEDFDREALVQALEAEAARTAPFRERPEVRVWIDDFNTVRREAFQPAVYRKSQDDLTTALKSMIVTLEGLATAAGIDLHPEDDEEQED